MLAGPVGKVQGSPVGLEQELGTLNDEAVKLPRGNSFRKGRSQTVKKVKDSPFLLMDLSSAALQLTDLAPGQTYDDPKHNHDRKHCDNDDRLDAPKDHGISSCNEITPKTSPQQS